MQITIVEAKRRAKSARGRTSSDIAGAASIKVACNPPKRGRDAECACAGVDLHDQPEHSSAMLDALGVALLNRGCLAEGARLIALALDIRREAFGPQHPLTALSLNSTARVLRERGELSEAEDVAQAALSINRRAFGDSSLPVAVSLVELGVTLLQQTRYAEAEAAADEGLSILERLQLTETDPNATRLMDVRARAAAARGALEDAKNLYERLLRIDKAQVGPQHPKFATHLANYASVQESLGLRQAEASWLRAIEVYAKRLRRRCHPNLIDMYANLGSFYLARNRTGDLRKAARYLDEALRLSFKVRGEAHVLVANDYANLGRLRYASGERGSALGLFRVAREIYEDNTRRGVIPQNFIFIAEVLNWIGRLLCESGAPEDAKQAQPLLEQALASWDASGAPGELGGAAARACLGRSLHLQSVDPEKARALLTQAYAALLQTLGPKHPFVKQVRRWVDELEPAANARAA